VIDYWVEPNDKRLCRRSSALTVGAVGVLPEEREGRVEKLIKAIAVKCVTATRNADRPGVQHAAGKPVSVRRNHHPTGVDVSVDEQRGRQNPFDFGDAVDPVMGE
jgi:protein subunit release factor A